MANVEHSTLTGASLHEPKGIDAAAANRVYVSDGVGSGSWSQVPAAAIVSSANSFEGQLLHLQHLESSGTNGGTLTASTWNKRTLNNELTNEIASASVASSVISLPAGVYYLEAEATVYAVTGARLRLRNTTDGTTLITGNSVRTSGQTPFTANTQTIKGRFTLAGTKNLELQNWTESTRNDTGMGIALTTGESEVYANLAIWKIS